MVRCFARERGEDDADKRRGIWIMDGDRGEFFHGDRKESQASRWDIAELEVGDPPHVIVTEITPAEVIWEFVRHDWPEAVVAAMRIFKRLGVGIAVKEQPCP